MEGTDKAKARVSNGKATRTGTTQTTTNSSKEQKATMAHTSAVLSTLIAIRHATADSDQSTIARCESRSPQDSVFPMCHMFFFWIPGAFYWIQIFFIKRWRWLACRNLSDYCTLLREMVFEVLGGKLDHERRAFAQCKYDKS